MTRAGSIEFGIVGNAPRNRALGGERLRARVPHGRYQTSTLISGIRQEGSCAPWLFEGPIDGEMFLAWVTEGLAPALRPGEVVILDPLATHKICGVREAIEAAGARLLYLPPYSPDFNPLEPMWSKVKQILRRQLPAPTSNCSWRPRPPFSPFLPPTARASFFGA